MCPLYPLHLVVLYLCLLLPLFLAMADSSLLSWQLVFSTPQLGQGREEADKLREETTATFQVSCSGCHQVRQQDIPHLTLLPASPMASRTVTASCSGTRSQG